MTEDSSKGAGKKGTFNGFGFLGKGIKDIVFLCPDKYLNCKGL